MSSPTARGLFWLNRNLGPSRVTQNSLPPDVWLAALNVKTDDKDDVDSSDEMSREY